MEQANSTGITIVAWWGAIVATIVLLWDIYKWKASGPKLRLEVLPDRVIYNDPEREGKIFISFQAQNIGSQPTTISSLYLRSYSSTYNRLLRRSNKAAYVKPDTVYPLPYVLDPGKVWEAFIIQSQDIEEWAKNSMLYCELSHSQDKRTQIAKLVIKNTPKK